MREKKQRKATKSVSPGTPRDSRGIPWEFPQTLSPGIPRELSCPFKQLPGKVGRALARLEAAAGMEETGPLLVAASPRRPRQDQFDTTGSRKQQARQQMTGFGHREGAQIRRRESGRRLRPQRQGRHRQLTSGASTADQKSQSQHDQRDMAVPPQQATHFIVIQTKVFAILKIFFNAKASSPSGDFGQQRGVRGSKEQVIGQIWSGSDAATDEQGVPAIISALLQHRHAGPLKKAWSFGALTDGQSLPVARLPKSGQHIANLQAAHAGSGEQHDGFITRNRTHVG